MVLSESCSKPAASSTSEARKGVFEGMPWLMGQIGIVEPVGSWRHAGQELRQRLVYETAFGTEKTTP